MTWGERDDTSVTLVIWVLDPETALILKATAAAAEGRGNKVSAFGPLLSKTLDFREGKLLAQGLHGRFMVTFHHKAALDSLKEGDDETIGKRYICVGFHKDSHDHLGGTFMSLSVKQC